MQLGRTPQSFLGPVELQELEPSLCDVANVAQQTTARARQQWRCHSIPAANINLAIAAYNRIWDKGSNRSKSRTKERLPLVYGVKLARLSLQLGIPVLFSLSDRN